VRVILKPSISGRVEIAPIQTSKFRGDWKSRLHKQANFGAIGNRVYTNKVRLRGLGYMKSEKWAITYNIGQKWAVILCCEAEEKQELRVAKIVEYLDNNYLLKQWAISDIDATGSYGNCLTARCNKEEIFQVSTSDLLEVMREEAQVIELDASLIKNGKELFKILIRDGVSIDIFGSGEMIPLTVLGKYVCVDKELFMW
jgi:hypothetical protein